MTEAVGTAGAGGTATRSTRTSVITVGGGGGQAGCHLFGRGGDPVCARGTKAVGIGRNRLGFGQNPDVIRQFLDPHHRSTRGIDPQHQMTHLRIGNRRIKALAQGVVTVRVKGAGQAKNGNAIVEAIKGAAEVGCPGRERESGLAVCSAVVISGEDDSGAKEASACGSSTQ